MIIINTKYCLQGSIYVATVRILKTNYVFSKMNFKSDVSNTTFSVRGNMKDFVD